MLALLIAAGVSMAFTLLLTPLFARAFRRLNLGQFIRADTPTTHVMKRGTPSMGGVVFVTAAIVGYFVGHLIGGGCAQCQRDAGDLHDGAASGSSGSSTTSSR